MVDLISAGDGEASDILIGMKPKPVVLFFRKLDLDRLRENPLVIAPRHPGHYPIPRLNGEDRLECYVVKFIRRFGKGYRRRSEGSSSLFINPSFKHLLSVL